jgi:hypothetical protein
MSCFERVVQVESRRFTEKLFDEVCNRLQTECDDSLMPFSDDPENLDENSLEGIFRKTIKWAD